MDPPDDDCTFYDAEDSSDAMGNAQAADAESPVVIDPRAGGVSLPDAFGESSTDDGVEGAGTSPQRNVVSLPDAFGESSTDDVEDTVARGCSVAVNGEANGVGSDKCETVMVAEALLTPPSTIRFADDSASSCGSVKEARDEIDDTAPVLVLPNVEPPKNELEARPSKVKLSLAGFPTDDELQPENDQLSDENVPSMLKPSNDTLNDELSVVEAPKEKLLNVETLKDEIPSVEATKDELQPAEAPKDELQPAEAPKDELSEVKVLKDELSKVEASKDELPKVDPPKEELPKVDPPKDDLPKVDPPKDELLKVEPQKDELSKVEPPKDELLKVEPPKGALPKVEPPNDDLSQVQPPNDDLPKVETRKDQPPKDQLPKDLNWEEDEEDEGYLAGVLGKTSDKAEARLAARRQARAEAREIRMRELERQQKEIEESCNKNYDSFTDTGGRTPRSAASIATRSTSLGGSNSYLSSRRSSEDSLEEGISLRDVRHELKEVEEKFRKAMIQNAQLDNEKASLTYQVELLKDRLEDLEEAHAQLQREHRDKGRELDQLKRATVKLKEDMEWYKGQMEERDRLIQEKGLMIVGDDKVSSDEDGSDEPDSNSPKKPRKRALVTIESAELLQSAGEGSLDVRLRRFAEERNELQDQVRHLKLELEEQYSRNKSEARRVSGATMNGPDTEVEDVQREANKLLGEYKFKLQKAEQDVSTLQATVARLESQVIRYKSASESAEKVEDELKVERRKLQRELRESQSRVEELEVSNSHLQRRLEKLKTAKSALLKEL